MTTDLAHNFFVAIVWGGAGWLIGRFLNFLYFRFADRNDGQEGGKDG